MSLQLAQRILSQAAKRTPKSTTTRPPGFKPSLGQALQGEGEFKAYNLDRLLEGQAVFRSVISKFRDTPQEETTLSKKAEQMLQSHDQEIVQRSKDRIKYRRLFRELYGPRTPSPTEERIPDELREHPRRRPTPVHMLPIPGNVPTDPGEEPVIPSLDEPGNIPEEEPVIPATGGYPTDDEPKEPQVDVYSCQAAEEDARKLGLDIQFCPRDAQTISIRALLRGEL